MRSASYILYMLWNCSGRTEYNPNLLKYSCSIECRYTFILLQLFNFLDLFWREHRKYLSRSLSSKNKIIPVTQFCWIPVALIILKSNALMFFPKDWRTPEHTVTYIQLLWVYIKRSLHFWNKFIARICRGQHRPLISNLTHLDLTILLVGYEQCRQQKCQGHLHHRSTTLKSHRASLNWKLWNPVVENSWMRDRTWAYL